MPLHISHRPETLKDMIGNRSLIASLESVLERQTDIPHAFLLTGPSGCGKTTIGRIIKTRLNCSEQDYHEVDSADFRGIDTIRSMRRNMRLKPMSGGCCVWLLDEGHKISVDGQHALLKALEDTPPHVYIILATTNPEKLLKTIKTRCTTYAVQELNQKQINKLLKDVCIKEDTEVPQEVLDQIAKDCLGSARSALVMLDTVIDMNESKMLEAVKRKAGEENQTIDLCRALINKVSWKEVSKIIKGIEQEPESVRRAVLGYCNSVLLNKGDDRTYQIMTCFENNYFDSGRAGLSMSCFESIFGE